jgi:hypothetical protein
MTTSKKTENPADRKREYLIRKDLYEFYNPMPLLESLILERDLADELRQQGHTILGGH